MSIVARIDQDGNCPTCHRSMLIGRAPSPASGEGGSTSALRASAPEGIDAMRAERDRYRDKLVSAAAIIAKDCWSYYEDEAYELAVDLYEFLRLPLPLNCIRKDHAPTQAVKQAIPSAAAQPPPPEGFICPVCHADRRFVPHSAACEVALASTPSPGRAADGSRARVADGDALDVGSRGGDPMDPPSTTAQAVKLANLARAPHSLAPEGIDATHTPLERQQQLAITYLGGLLQRHRVGTGWRLRGSHQDVEAAWKLANEAMAAYHAVPIAVREAIQPAVQSAPLTPEGTSVATPPIRESPRQKAMALKIAVRSLRMLDDSDARAMDRICQGVDALAARVNAAEAE